MAEELGLDEFGREGAAVDGHEGPVAAGTGAVDRSRHQFLACAGLSFDQDGHRAGGDPPSAEDDAFHCRTAVQDLVELRGFRRQAGGQTLEFPVGPPEKVGKEVRADVERHGRDADPVSTGGFDELRRETGLGQNDPDRRHRRRAGAQVEGQRAGVGRLLHHSAASANRGSVDLSEVRRAAQGLLHYLNLDLGVPGLKPRLVRRDGARLMVRQQASLVEAQLLERLCDGPRADVGALLGCAKIGGADP